MSYLSSTSLLLARTFLQYEAGTHPWQRINGNLRSTCPSVDVKGLLTAVEGKPVVSRAELSHVVDSCLSDGGLIADSLARGGSMHVKNAYGWGPLHEVARSHSHRLLPVLLEAGADPHLQALHGVTPLHVAVSAGDSVAVSQLLSHDSAILGIMDVHGRTAFDLACLHAERFGHGKTKTDSLSDQWPAWLKPVVVRLQQSSDTQLTCNDDGTAYTDQNVWSPSLESTQPRLPEAVQMVAAQPCGIPERDGADLTPEQFVRDFLTVSRPVMVRRAALTTAGPKARRALLRKWSTEGLSKVFADRPFDVGHVPKPKTFAGINSTTMSLQAFAKTRLVRWDHSDAIVEGESTLLPEYIFDTISQAEASKLLTISGQTSDGKLTLTPNITNIEGLVVAGGSTAPGKGADGRRGNSAGFERGTLQFSLGAALSGTPLHWHNDAINHLVRGRKLWTLQAPPHATYSRVHAQLEVTMPVGDGDALRCVQEAGDVIFVPDSWGHAVLNLDESAAYASTFYGPRYMFVHSRATEPH
jgi:hypothetical protein